MTDLWGSEGSKFFSTVLMNTEGTVVVDTKLLGFAVCQFESLKLKGTALANELILYVLGYTSIRPQCVTRPRYNIDSQ